MRQEQLLPDLIYEYFVMHFHSHFYRYGDMLPTIEKISQDCCVSLDTAKTVLKRLRNEGYVTLQNTGKAFRLPFHRARRNITPILRVFFPNAIFHYPT